MNVAFDPWIPVLDSKGNRVLVSPWDILTGGHQYIDLVVRPHERVALMRFLISLSHAALDGPRDFDAWESVPQDLPDAAQNYLKKWKEAFELFHPQKPWLQIAELQKTKSSNAANNTDDWTPVSKLNFSLATGNNTTLFDHKGLDKEREISLEETIVSMITFQCFSLAGLSSQVFWNSQQSEKTAKDAPCAPSSMLHTFIRGSNLMETLHANLPWYEYVQQHYLKNNIGRPIWELFPKDLNDSKAIENATTTYLGRLVPLSRFILLSSSAQKMLWGAGLAYPNYAGGFPPEPTATVYVRKFNKKEEPALLPFRTNKAYWRELPSILLTKDINNIGGPFSLQMLPENQDFDVLVAALARDQANVVDVKESVYSIPSKIRSEEGLNIFKEEVDYCDEVANKLGWAIETYRQEIDAGWEGRLKMAGPKTSDLKNKLKEQAALRFWTQVENKLSYLYETTKALGTDAFAPTQSTWRKLVYATACDSFRATCGQNTPRQMRAFAKGWQRLSRKKTDATEASIAQEDDK
ncbi:MAG: type I-E CRISPR-associated protein Cse1/CasA [Proteobacteria bacterium]|nr:type I-E CRISPR-associated protein Cse1/CasA [Pseudomonadota bacterium]